MNFPDQEDSRYWNNQIINIYVNYNTIFKFDVYKGC